MLTQNQARLIAAVAAPLFLLHATPGRCAPGQAASSSAPVQMQHISITATGKGSPVILIPGLSSPRAVYDGVAPELARTNRVYLVQVNGFAGEDPRANLQPGILDGVVAELSGFIAANKLGRPAIVGHSMGGLIGLMFAKAHPDQIGKLMVVDSLPYIGDIFVPGATVAQIEPQAKMMRDQIAAGYGKPADPAAGQRTAAGMALKPDSQAKVAAWVGVADPRITAEAMYEDMTTDLRGDVAAIQTPITLVYPSNAQLTKERADAFYHAEYAKAPRVTFVNIDDSAHFIMLDQPAEFQAALDAFLAG